MVGSSVSASAGPSAGLTGVPAAEARIGPVLTARAAAVPVLPPAGAAWGRCCHRRGWRWGWCCDRRGWRRRRRSRNGGRRGRRSHRRRRLARRPGARAARDEGEILGQRGRNPRHLFLPRGAGDADTGAVQRFFRHQVGGADFLQQLFHEQAAVAAIVGNHRRERGRIHHQRAVRRDHRRKAGGKAAEPALERVAPGGVDQRDLDAGAAAVDLAQHGFEAETVAADVRFGPDLGIDRNHVALAAGLHAKAGKEQQRHRARLDLAVQAVEGPAHLLGGQVFADVDIEAVALELFGDVARIVDRLFQRRFGVRIFRVADHQRIALTGCERRGDRRDSKKQCKEQCEADFHNDGSPDHGSPAKIAPIPARAAATLLYAPGIIKPSAHSVNRLRYRH